MVLEINKFKGGKKIRSARTKIESTKYYNVTEALENLKEFSFVKFDETLDINVKLGVDPRHSDQTVRGIVLLPAGTGKNIRIAVICKDETKISEALAAGADIVGSGDLIDEIKSGKINFDVCIATPDMMPSIGAIAKILGPKGLMPNPKLGTVTNDIQNAVKNVKNGQVEFRAESKGIVHAGIGKLSFSIKNLHENVKAFVAAVIKAKPSGAKGNYLKAIYLSSSMGVSLKIDLASVS
jgi:large subunit ribosomal protein L1